MNPLEEYYGILGLKPNASPQEIKQAYRNLVKNWHPDYFISDPELKQQAEEKIKLINQAYKVLKSIHINGTIASSAEIAITKINPEFFYKQGVINAEQEQYSEAIEDFSRAISLNPNYIEAYQYRGFLREKLGFKNAAESDFQTVYKLKLTELVRKQASSPSPSTNPSPCQQTSSSPVTSTSSSKPSSYKKNKIDADLQNCLAQQPKQIFAANKKSTKELASELLELLNYNSIKAEELLIEIFSEYPHKSIDWYYEQAIIKVIKNKSPKKRIN
jgi:curved DNA-binding protein CbpA